MRLDLDNLPVDTALLHQLVRDMASVVDHRNDEIERLQAIIKKLQRMQFGRSAERLDPDQLALALEDLDADIGQIEQSRPVIFEGTIDRQPHRKPLPDHLPRDEVMLDIADGACPACHGALHSIGESVSEMLDWVPAQLRVMRIVRPKYACRACGTITQISAPERVIAGGLATPALLTQVLIAKYCDHTPLYRQSQIFARRPGPQPRLAKRPSASLFSSLAALTRWRKTRSGAGRRSISPSRSMPIASALRARARVGRP